MADAESLLDLVGKVFSSHSLDVDNIVSQEIHSRANRRVRILRITEGARASVGLATKVIVVFSLVTSRSFGKFAFRIKNPSLFIF